MASASHAKLPVTAPSTRFSTAAPLNIGQTARLSLLLVFLYSSDDCFDNHDNLQSNAKRGEVGCLRRYIYLITKSIQPTLDCKKVGASNSGRGLQDIAYVTVTLRLAFQP